MQYEYRTNIERREHRRMRRRRRRMIAICIRGILLLAGLLILVMILGKMLGSRKTKKLDLTNSETVSSIEALRPELDVELLDINPYSRPGKTLEQVKGIVIHYTANPGSSAMANRNYFNGLATSHATSASSHFIVGIDGEIVQCVPCNEIAYASNNRNSDTLSIECCHPDSDGKFTDDTYRSMVELTAWLVVRYNLTENDVIRHYDVTGKICPKYFVDHEDAWTQFKKDVGDAAEELKQKL